MINEQTCETLRKMKLAAMADELMHQLKDKNAYNSLGFEERLGLMVDAEWNRRQSNKLARYIKIANFSIPSASIEGCKRQVLSINFRQLFSATFWQIKSSTFA